MVGALEDGLKMLEKPLALDDGLEVLEKPLALDDGLEVLDKPLALEIGLEALKKPLLLEDGLEVFEKPPKLSPIGWHCHMYPGITSVQNKSLQHELSVELPHFAFSPKQFRNSSKCDSGNHFPLQNASH